MICSTAAIISSVLTPRRPAQDDGVDHAFLVVAHLGGLEVEEHEVGATGDRQVDDGRHLDVVLAVGGGHGQHVADLGPEPRGVGRVDRHLVHAHRRLALRQGEDVLVDLTVPREADDGAARWLDRVAVLVLHD
jgi:hypothetical protein